jgi:hypothetical protein
MGIFDWFSPKPKPARQAPAIDYHAIFSAKFKIVQREIATVRQLIHQKDGSFFETHKYSVEELVQLPQMNKIKAACGAIRADVDNWIRATNFPPEAQEAYRVVHSGVDSSIQALEEEINSREPTWVECFISAFKGFAKVIMTILPPLSFLLNVFGYSLPGGDVPPQLPPSS